VTRGVVGGWGRGVGQEVPLLLLYVDVGVCAFTHV
jgi:hypothetical protein